MAYANYSGYRPATANYYTNVGDYLAAPTTLSAYTNNNNNPTLAPGAQPRPASEQAPTESPLDKWFKQRQRQWEQFGPAKTGGGRVGSGGTYWGVQQLPPGAMLQPPNWQGGLSESMYKQGWRTQRGPDGQYYWIPPGAGQQQISPPNAPTYF